MAAVAGKASRRPLGRPSKGILSKESITAAALTVINDHGYSGLTMSALAKELKVAPSALYNHAASKHDVLLWVEDRVMKTVDVGGFVDLPWADAVERWAWSYRDVFARHSPLIPIIAVLPVTGAPQTVKMYEAVTQGFLDAGWDEPRIVPAIVALESFIFGSAYDATAPADIFDPGELAESNPRFTSAVAAREQYPDESAADSTFRLGLRALVAGLEGTMTGSGRRNRRCSPSS